MFALRDGGEGDELVTDENLRKKIRERAALKYDPFATHPPASTDTLTSIQPLGLSMPQ
jgi:hypothetical protein